MRSWFKAVAQGDGSAEISIYDEIGLWGIRAGDFRDALAGLGDIGAINLRLNSPGGDVFDGIAIHNMLARHPATINVTVDGMAASIASLIAMAGDHVAMPENAMMMVHNPFGFAMGEADDMRAVADALDKIRSGMVTTYAARTKLEPEAIIGIMDAETWLTADEAKVAGFADEVIKSVKIAARFDLNRFAHPPKAMLRRRALAAVDPDDLAERLDRIEERLATLGEGTETQKEGPAEDPTLPSANAEEIASLCLIAGMPGRTLAFLQSGKTPKQVRSELQALRADQGHGPESGVSARHAIGGIDVTASWDKTLNAINLGRGASK
jgi:ATP-dependent Clp protease protease subunit